MECRYFGENPPCTEVQHVDLIDRFVSKSLQSLPTDIINQPFDQPVVQSASQPTSQSISQSTTQTASQPTGRSIR